MNHTSQTESKSEGSIADGIGRALNWMAVLVCIHDFILVRDEGFLLVECRKCLKRSPGIWAGRKREP